jgi:curved DNA-binding protein
MASAQTDPYSILGVPRNADSKTIKSAYRRLAQAHHPDRNQDDSVAEERFKAISGAYAVLSDAKRRKNYDEFGSVAMDPNFNAAQARASRNHPFGNRGAGGAGFGTIFDDFFANADGGFSNQQGPRRTKGRDRELLLQLDLREASDGCERRVSLGRAGSSNQGETLRVRVPPGTRNDGRIRLAGQGNPGAHGGPPGDLYCRIKLRPHPFFNVDAFDLLLDVPISLKEAILGAEIEIPTLSGRVTLNVPAGTDAGSRLRLRGKGIARPGEKPPGDLYVTLLIRVPTDLDDEAREHVLELDRHGPNDLRKHLLD